MTVWAIVVAAGSGSRFGGQKQFQELEGRRVVDWAIAACLSVADEAGGQVAMHTDGLNEAGSLAETIGAIAGRPIHAYHVEGSGGGHAQNLIEICSVPNVTGSSNNPTLPATD